MNATEEVLRENGISYLLFLRKGVVRNIARIESGGVPGNWEHDDVPLPPEILPLLYWRLEQLNRVLEHYQAGKPFDAAPPFLVGAWAEALDGSGDDDEEDDDE